MSGTGDYSYITPSAPAAGGGSSGASYLVVALDPDLTGERSIAFNATNFTVTDGGAGSTYSVNLVQNLATTSSPTFVGLTVSDLTASRLVATNGFSDLASVADLTTWIAGTASQVVVTSDGDGTVTLSGPQNLATTSSPTFANLTLGTGGAVRAGTAAGNTLLLQAYDTDTGPAYSTFITLTSGTAPSCDLATGVTIDGAVIYRVGGPDVAVTDGGTGLSLYTQGALLYASTTTALAGLADVATGSVLASGGVNTVPAWSDTLSLAGLTLTINSDAGSGTDEDPALVLLGGDGVAATNDDIVRTTISQDSVDEFVSIVMARNRNAAGFATIATNLHIGSPTVASNLDSVLTLNAYDGAAKTASTLTYDGSAEELIFGGNTRTWRFLDDEGVKSIVVGENGTGDMEIRVYGTTLNITNGGGQDVLWNATNVEFAGVNIRCNDGIYVEMGNSADVRMQWSDYNTAHSFVVGVGAVNANSRSGNVIICEVADVNENFTNTHSLGTSNDPRLFIWSGDATAPDYIQLYHNQTDAYQNIGSGSFFIQLAGTSFLKLEGDSIEVEDVKTITGAVTDDYSAALRLDPGYTAATALTVTRHNYIDVQDVSVAGAGPAAVTDACVLRFDAVLGTHKATIGATTKTTPGGVDGWFKTNANGTLMYVPMYISTTA